MPIRVALNPIMLYTYNCDGFDFMSHIIVNYDSPKTANSKIKINAQNSIVSVITNTFYTHCFILKSILKIRNLKYCFDMYGF